MISAFSFYFIYMHLSSVNGMLNVLYSGQKEYCYVGTRPYMSNFGD
jgi:hypothetical protein